MQRVTTSPYIRCRPLSCRGGNLRARARHVRSSIPGEISVYRSRRAEKPIAEEPSAIIKAAIRRDRLSARTMARPRTCCFVETSPISAGAARAFDFNRAEGPAIPARTFCVSRDVHFRDSPSRIRRAKVSPTLPFTGHSARARAPQVSKQATLPIPILYFQYGHGISHKSHIFQRSNLQVVIAVGGGNYSRS